MFFRMTQVFAALLSSQTATDHSMKIPHPRTMELTQQPAMWSKAHGNFLLPGVLQWIRTSFSSSSCPPSAKENMRTIFFQMIIISSFPPIRNGQEAVRLLQKHTLPFCCIVAGISCCSSSLNNCFKRFSCHKKHKQTHPDIGDATRLT